MTIKTQVTKEKIHELAFKKKKLNASKDYIRRVKEQHTE
jgi:hypothetical protein